MRVATTIKKYRVLAVLLAGCALCALPASAEGLKINPYPFKTSAPAVTNAPVQPITLAPSLEAQPQAAPAMQAEAAPEDLKMPPQSARMSAAAEAAEPVPQPVPQNSGSHYDVSMSEDGEFSMSMSDADVNMSSPAQQPAPYEMPPQSVAPVMEPVAQDSMEQVYAPSSGGPVGWHADEGRAIQEALHDWSRSADVELIWKAQGDFAVRETVNVEGSYEQAVQALLDQHHGEDFRPVGSLHIDPTSGRRVLVIETYREG